MKAALQPRYPLQMQQTLQMQSLEGARVGGYLTRGHCSHLRVALHASLQQNFPSHSPQVEMRRSPQTISSCCCHHSYDDTIRSQIKQPDLLQTQLSEWCQTVKERGTSGFEFAAHFTQTFSSHLSQAMAMSAQSWRIEKCLAHRRDLPQVKG